MRWTIEYFEQENTAQPAELFEDELDQTCPQLAGKLIRICDLLEVEGFRLGGGLIEKCHNYQGLWEMRAIYAGMLAREFFGFDGERIVLLYGYVKRTGQPASDNEFEKAFRYWREYQRTRCISPMQEEDTNE